jgi:hypothetical protein
MNEEIKTNVSQEDLIKKANKKVSISFFLIVFALLFLILDLLVVQNMLGFFLAVFALILVSQAKKLGTTKIKNVKTIQVLSYIVMGIKMLEILATFLIMYSKK